MSSTKPKMVTPPFSDAQVDALNEYQKGERFHSYTCCNHQVMVATTDKVQKDTGLGLGMDYNTGTGEMSES